MATVSAIRGQPMTLFTFTLHGELFALPGEEIRQVLVPEAGPGFILEKGGRFARHGDCRLPILEIPGETGERTADLGSATILQVARGRSGEGFLAVDSAAGLVEVTEILALPPYLFPEGRSIYRGLFRMEGITGTLLHGAALVDRSGAARA